jgi:hypothetical protein
MHPKQTLHLAEGFPDCFLDVVRHSDTKFVRQTYILYRFPCYLLLGRPHQNLITVAGDAYHPISSDLSLGSCMALEDAVILPSHISNCLQKEQNGHDLNEVIEAYVNERRRVCSCSTNMVLPVTLSPS